MDISRRGVLAGLAALIIGVHLPVGAHASDPPAAPDGPPLQRFNAFVAIAKNGEVSILIPSSEMGQGVMTSLPQILAEELDCDWAQITVEHAPEGKPYRRTLGLGKNQVTGGSTSISGWFEPMRQAGAAAREMLVVAAANRWDVDPAQCTTENGVVRHADGHEATYGDLVQDAARLKPPKKPTLKDESAFRLIGTSVPRTDLRGKVTGKAEYGVDVRIPGMVRACSVACPVFGGRVGKVDDSKAREIPGVTDVLVFDDFVAVIADTWWPAKRGVQALDITWDEGTTAEFSTESIRKQLRDGLETAKIAVGKKEGKALKALEEGADIDSLYEVPYLDHAPMEPQNCTVHVQDDRCDVWAGTQAQTSVRKAAMEITGLKEEQVHVNTVMLGGGFGRRGNIDDAEQAVKISARLKKPVQLLWTREESIRHGWYRPVATGRLRAKISNGELEAVHIRIASPNILHRYLPKFLHGLGPVKKFPMEGMLHSSPYVFPQVQVDWARVDLPIPIGFWRSVGHSYSGFFMESFLDEIAAKLGKDPVEFRRSLIGPEHPRFRKVLDVAVEKGGWGSAPDGRFQGVALHESFGSITAEVAEISMEDGLPRVHKVTAAVDCGRAVNPAIIKDQIMSAVIYGLSSAMGEKLDIDRGRVVQGNFHNYPILRMNQAPEVETHIIETPGAPIGGIGEVGLPPVIPAVCNAIFAATGKRVRQLPLRDALAKENA